MKTHLLWILLFGIVFNPINLREVTAADPAAGAPRRAEKKIGGIMGDPARKRGMELGYDAGLKAVKSEGANPQIKQATLRPEYVNANDQYRYEYGNRAQFLAGFRSGFLGAYRTAMKKSGHPKSPEASSAEAPTEGSVAKAPPVSAAVETYEIPKAPISTASDAL